MAARTIAHALFSWTENGEARLATHGQTVEIDDDVIAAYERHGVFEPDEAAPEPVAAEPATRPATLPVPRAASDKAAWLDYAAALDLHFATGVDKQHIIDTVTEHEGNDHA